MTAAERRRAIVELLNKRRSETETNLAYRFGVSRRTIVNDVMMLSLSYPVYTTKGNGGGVFISDDFDLYCPRLTAAELDLLKRILEKLSGEEREIMLGLIKKGGGLYEA